MKTSFRAVITTVAAALALAFGARAAANVTHHTHFSKYMGNQMWGYNIYLPDGYDAGVDRYPVIYMLHGYGDTEDRMIFMADTLHNAIRLGKVPKVIMVFPNGGKQTFYCDYSVWPWMKGYDADSYISKEFIPYIDSAYRTIATRPGRLIQGFSMGGWGSLHFAFKYPALFSRVCALSPGGRNVDSLDNPTALSTTNAATLKTGTKIRMVAGGADALKTEADAFDALWTRLGLAHEYEVVPGAKHSPETIYGATGQKDLIFLTSNLSVNVSRKLPESNGPRLSLESASAVSLRLSYTLPAAARTALGVRDLSGRPVRMLVSGMRLAGEHRVSWDLKDGAGLPARASTYVITLSAGAEARSLLVPILK